MKPLWMQNLEGDINTCSGGDVFHIIAMRIANMIVTGFEDMINFSIVKWINDALGWMGVHIDDVCFKGPIMGVSKTCPREHGTDLQDGWMGCDLKEDGEMHKRCYFKRQRAICMDEGDRTERYKALFEGEDPNSLDAQFKKIAGEGYEQTPPTMLAAFQGAYTQTQRATSHKTGLPLQEEEVDKICGQSLVESLTLDEVRQCTRKRP